MEPRILTVPIDPEFLPEAALLLGGVIASVVAVGLLLARERGQGLRVGVASVACIALAITLGRSGWVHPSAKFTRQPVFLQPASIPARGPKTEGPPYVSLVLGGVTVRVEPMDHYDLALNNEPFLTLDSLSSGLVLSCNAATERPGVYAHVSRNYLVPTGSGAGASLPDAHTFLLEDEGKTIARVHYQSPRVIEISGRFHPFQGWRGSVPSAPVGSAESNIITLGQGIRWSGGGIPPGNTIDLRQQARGKIDFAGSGMVQIRAR